MSIIVGNEATLVKIAIALKGCRIESNKLIDNNENLNKSEIINRIKASEKVVNETIANILCEE